MHPSSSSLLSPQSFAPSHLKAGSKHFLFRQRKFLLGHLKPSKSGRLVFYYILQRFATKFTVINNKKNGIYNEVCTKVMASMLRKLHLVL